MIEYITSQGDTVDYIAWKHYGSTENGIVEAVLEANPGLAKNPPELVAGLVIVLPDVQTPRAEEIVTLWT